MLHQRIRSVLIYFVLALAGSLSGQPAFNYAEALQKSMFFYEAQRSGVLPANNRVTWRGNSALDDGADVGRDLTGGWYDGGDHVKFGFPMAYAATALAWGAIDFREGYVTSGQLQALKNNLRFVNDYFIRAHTAPQELWGQVGLAGIDHAFWGSAEILMMERPAFKIDATRPGSELAAETAAAMAAASMVFASDDPAYSATLLRHAIQLYDFADNVRGIYSESIPEAASFYRSFGGFNDELVWGAIWLYRATGQIAYLNKAEAYYANLRLEFNSLEKEFEWTIGWEGKAFGCYVLLAKLTGKPVYKADAERNLDYWTDGVNGRRVRYTPGGLAFLNEFSTLGYAANASFLAFYYHDIATTPAKATAYYNFGVRQMNYILGANPLHRSYVVGFGVNPPKNPHHRTAHGAWANNVIGSPTESRHVLYGALLGGPRLNDDYFDDRSNFQGNEVTTNTNALFSGALAKLVNDFGGAPLANFPLIEKPTDEYLVEAKFNPAGPVTSDYSVWVNNHTAWPARIPHEFKFRVFIDITEGLAAGFSPANYIVSSRSSNVTLTNLLRWTPGANIYYTEVTFTPDTLIWPGGSSEAREEAQISVGLPLTAPAAAWSAVNDWSNRELDGALKFVNFIPLYADGVLVAGAEPPRVLSVPVSGINVSPGSTSVSIGGIISLTASVLPSGASNPALSWTSLNPSIAGVTPSGVVTGRNLGTTTVRASTVEGGFSAASVISVLPGNGLIPVYGVSVTPATASILVGSTLSLTATVVPANASRGTVSWSSSNPAVASLNFGSLLTALAPGTATITATTADGGLIASSLVTVTGIQAGEVTVIPRTTVIRVGSATTLTALVTPANATNKTVTWVSSASEVARVTPAGIVIGVAPGQATITATTAGGGFRASSIVTVVGESDHCTVPTPITLNFAKDGAGDFCYFTTGRINFINSWNMQLVEINGVVLTNRWLNSLPARVNGGYVIHYVGTFPWSHLEINGTQ